MEGTFFPPVKSKNDDWFVKSSYWCRWSRALVRMDNEGLNEAIDISVEPMDFVDIDRAGWEKHYSLDRLKEMRIRVHSTREHERCFSKELPGGTESYLQLIAGEYFANLLLHVDLFNEIDHDQLARYDTSSSWPFGGGIPFAMVCKDRDKYEPVVRHWCKVMSEDVKYLGVQDEDMLKRYTKYLKEGDGK